jgi:hypothetical protein
MCGMGSVFLPVKDCVFSNTNKTGKFASKQTTIQPALSDKFPKAFWFLVFSDSDVLRNIDGVMDGIFRYL